MIRLGELAAAVLKEVTIARTQAALFGEQMAADFRDHDILGRISFPALAIKSAEVSVPFAVAASPPDRDEAKQPGFAPDELASAVKKATAALPQQARLKAGFALHAQHTALWRKSAPPEIAERLVAAGAADMPLSGVVALYGALVKNRYLVSLLEKRPTRGARVAAAALPMAKINQTVASKMPDLVEETASRLLAQELEKATAGRAKMTAAKRLERKPPALPESVGVDSPVYVEVGAEELQKTQRVATLTLRIEEGLLEDIAISETEEGEHG